MYDADDTIESFEMWIEIYSRPRSSGRTSLQDAMSAFYDATGETVEIFEALAVLSSRYETERRDGELTFRCIINY